MLASRILRNASALVAVSEFTASEARRLYPEAKEAQVVHCGVDLDRFQPVSDREALKLKRGCGGRPVMLSVSRLVRHKGHTKALSALRDIVRHLPNVLYTIIGEGKEEGTIRKAVSELGLQKNVLLLGRVPDAELAEWYALADVFVLPTSDTHETESGSRAVEGFGMVAIEANACGRPVVVGRSGGTADAVVDGVTGFLVDADDPVSVMDSTLRLLTDSALADRLGRQGRERAEREFTWENTTKGIRNALRSLDRPGTRS
jgi:phosphatidylinositol alpha-1,6-mannosyltransferase